MATNNPADGATGTGKKTKKNKGTKLLASEFLDSSSFKFQSESGLGGGWAEEMEGEEVISPSFNTGQVSLPSAPKSAFVSEYDLDSIPSSGPYRLSVANLQYEVNEDQLCALFSNMKVKECHLNNVEGRANGTAWVEFYSRQELIDALAFNSRSLNGRPVRIYLPNQDNRYGDRDGGRRGGPRGGNYVDNTPSNWRSSTRPEPSFTGKQERVYPPPTNNYGRDDRGYGSRGSRYGGGNDDFSRPPRNDYGGGRRDYDDRRDRRDRYGDDRGGNWGRGPRGGADSAEPDEGNWRREGPPPAPTSDRNGGSYPPRRDNRGGGGGYGGRDEMPPPSKDQLYGPPPHIQRSGNEYGRNNERGDNEYSRRGDDFERRPPSDDYEPRRNAPSAEYDGPSRNFVPPPRDRTYSGRSDRTNEEHPNNEPKADDGSQFRILDLKQGIAKLLDPDQADEKPASYQSIFGSAKPVDTSKREQEIEKRLAEERAREAEKLAAAKAESATAVGTSSGTATTDSNRIQRDSRGPPPRMGRKENGDSRDRLSGGRGGDRRHDRYDDRNGALGDRRRDDRGRRMGGEDGGRRMGGGGLGGRRRDDGYYGDGSRSGGGQGGGRYSSDRRGDDRGPRGSGSYDDGGSRRYYGGSGVRGDYDSTYDRNRYISEGDDKESKNYITTNKYQYLDDEGHTSN
ncbi:hypothetical protein RDWZM_003813 [Blomia tropicalis]|uniref:RRM domain-containing protein n=1 Tax=Blomia tropicalis TaxID=40697 RepID=A0A9Q0MHM3_BLOTA|nr:Eukaryotic translation initiation factor 4B [Blomia tropicalis]KAJ6225268.1 hypothetical protein RDWZM_003813 [Blomia tropicalis]